MRIPAKIADTFSPYLDPNPWLDFYEDLSKRGVIAIALACLLHIALITSLALGLRDLAYIPEEPDIIPVQIIAVAAKDNDAPPPPAEEEIVIAPATPSPKPKPTPRPTPPPPPPQIIEAAPPPPPEPEIVPEPEPAPPPPEILAAPEPEPAPEEELLAPPLVSDEVRAAAAQALIDRMQQQDTPPETIIEPNVEPIIEPEPIIDPTIEPVIEPVIEPIIEPQPQIEIFDPAPILEPVIEPVIEPAPIIEPEIIPEIEIFEPEPLPEPEVLPEIIIDAPLPEPDQPILDAAPGAIIEEPAPDLPPEPITLPSPVPEEIIEPEPSEAPPAPDAPAIETPEEDALIETAPSVESAAPRVLADDDAPESEAERSRAVSESQADTGGAYRTPTFGGGGGAPLTSRPGGAGAPPPSGAPGRANPGAGGWSLPTGAYEGESEGGLGGIRTDMDCRREDRTHLDCPEYVKKPSGRDASGWEGQSIFRNSQIGGQGLTGGGRAAPAGGRIGTSRHNPAIGGGLGSSDSPGGGWTGNTSGLPSTSVIDDADFGRTFRGTPLGGETDADARRRENYIIQNQEGTDTSPQTETPKSDDPWALESIPDQ